LGHGIPLDTVVLLGATTEQDIAQAVLLLGGVLLWKDLCVSYIRYG